MSMDLNEFLSVIQEWINLHNFIVTLDITDIGEIDYKGNRITLDNFINYDLIDNEILYLAWNDKTIGESKEDVQSLNKYYMNKYETNKHEESNVYVITMKPYDYVINRITNYIETASIFTSKITDAPDIDSTIETFEKITKTLKFWKWMNVMNK